MKAIYAVVSGEYSDYTVHCLSLTEELADAVATKMGLLRGHGAYGIEVREMHLVESTDDIFETTTYAVDIDERGNEQRRWTFLSESWREDSLSTAVDQGRTTVAARGVSRRGYDVALKAARDALAEHKARQEGV